MKKILMSLFSMLLVCISTQVAANSKVGEVIEDSAITTAVKAKMASNPLVSAIDFKVETEKGVVLLQGTVKTAAEADKAVEIAHSVEGAIDVDASGIQIQNSSRPLSDSIITAKVKGVYIREKIFGNEDISATGVHVETTEGVVYLTGKVANKEQANNAEKLAKLVKGVKDVKMDLHIKK